MAAVRLYQRCSDLFGGSLFYLLPELVAYITLSMLPLIPTLQVRLENCFLDPEECGKRSTLLTSGLCEHLVLVEHVDWLCPLNVTSGAAECARSSQVYLSTDAQKLQTLNYGRTHKLENTDQEKLVNVKFSKKWLGSDQSSFPEIA